MNQHPDNTAGADTVDSIDTLTVHLAQPITLGSVAFAELQLKEPTVSDLIAAAKASTAIESVAILTHRTAAVPMAVVQRIKQRDFQRAADFFARFSDDTTTQAAGSTSSR